MFKKMSCPALTFLFSDAVVLPALLLRQGEAKFNTNPRAIRACRI